LSRSLIDTSAWIHFLRPKGDGEARARVEAALRDGSACWCAMVRLELWNGAAGEPEKRALRRLEAVLPDLEIGREVWREAHTLARAARTAGVTVPATDLLIAACAAHHGAEVVHADRDFDRLSAL